MKPPLLSEIETTASDAAKVCDALLDFQRGVWIPYLTKPELWTIRNALAKALAALPPDEMTVFWENLQSGNAVLRQAMLRGVEFLCEQHALPHLLYGLENCRDHAIRAALVDCLEQVADPRSLPVLNRLRRETAAGDWTLSRHIARAVRVIERQNGEHLLRNLLRPADPPETSEDLLRPIGKNEIENEADRKRLLRPPE